jgi:hypothetical protein
MIRSGRHLDAGDPITCNESRFKFKATVAPGVFPPSLWQFP